ncbi:MAG: GMC family oxidoreductase N-terminal domain-containing protein [Candidatus Nanopelagicaceae bacterium]
MAGRHFDVLIIGSGFGGSVSALRLVEKGYRVGVLEAGRRFDDHDFPKTSWRLHRFLFFPRFGLNGLQRIHALPDVLILSGAGVGGGSLVYANTLYRPPDSYFNDPQWSGITDWSAELDRWYDQASRMLGVSTNPFHSPSDEVMLQVARSMGREASFKLAPLGIHFGKPGESVPDPYFGGKGPRRSGCINCGECMTGCRHNAKNTLPKNYLGLAESAGAEVIPNTTAISLELKDHQWRVKTRRSSSWFGGVNEFTADQVIVACGTYNTLKLLHSMKSRGVLPKISSTLGDLARTNSESLTGVVMKGRGRDFSQGAAITSSFFPDDRTHVEPVRYGKGSNFMGLLQTVMTDGATASKRRRSWLVKVLKNPISLLRILNVRKWSERSIVALVMQNVDSAITVRMKRGIFGNRLTSRNNSSNPNATYIPLANEVARRVAAQNNGVPVGHVGDLVSAPFTAHFVGGCVIGEDEGKGVIDPYHRVWNYPSLHVIDGSTLTANLGVNPSLTIAAQAERAISMWPNKGDTDPRPGQGSPYQRIDVVAPLHPVVPFGAIGELR